MRRTCTPHIAAAGYMAKMMWRKTTTTKTTTKQQASPPAACDAARAAGGDGKFPRGYVPVRLVVGGDGDGGEAEQERVLLVPVALLNEPRMVELLEMAERRYGYGQPGVLRIPCDAQSFQQLMGLPCMAR